MAKVTKPREVDVAENGRSSLQGEDPETLRHYYVQMLQLPLATGAAYALKYQARPGVVVCQMGDATTNIGAWHESLNLAALWQLPIIYLVVNNGYGMGTTVAEGAAEPELYKRGCAFRMQ